MGCEQGREKLDLYLDGEMKSEEAQSFGAHVRSCAACAADALQRVQMKRSVALAGKRYEASAQLRSRIAQSVAVKPRQSFGWRWAGAAAMACVVLVAAVAVRSHFDREREAQQRVYSELADLHVATLASATPVDVVSTDRHTVKPWFQGKIPFTFTLPELQGSEFSLVGGRVTYLEQTSGAHLIYQVKKHQISVFIFPERETSIPSGVVNQLTFNVDSWSKNGLRYFVIGDTNADDIRALSKLLRDAG